MPRPNRENSIPPAPLTKAPYGAKLPLPGSVHLTMSPQNLELNGGNVLMGGSPLRLLRLSDRGKALVAKWTAGAAVGETRIEQLLARRLVSAGVCFPQPTTSGYEASDVTVVIPVRDRPAQLQRLLASLKGLACVVVDDASADPSETAAIAKSVEARFIALPENLGPAGARNAGLMMADTPLVAFVDSDCEPNDDWLLPLLGHFDDPLVAVVAPRIVPAHVESPTALVRYEAVRSSLDRGSAPGLVRPLSAIPYIPSAAMVVRRSVAGTALFDEALRGGEDVDLVWRMVEAGWEVRYVPDSVVAHSGPTSTREWLARRTFYGTTAGPLARRHPDNLWPLQTSAWSAATWALLWFRRPILAAGTLGYSVITLGQRLNGLVDDPFAVALKIAGGGTTKSALPALSGLTRAWSPALLLGLIFRRSRWAAGLALLLPAVNDYLSNPGELDPVRYTALHVTDDVAYGVGVWRGCLQARSLRPLIPRIHIRSRVWSSSSLRQQLKASETTTRRDGSA